MASLKLDDPGGMAAVFAPLNKVQTIIEPFQSSLTISNFNSPGQTVVSGTTAAIGFCSPLRGTKDPCQQLPVSHAFHSEIVALPQNHFGRPWEGNFEKMSSKVI
jgi:acyl transferase domain-containing protein